MKVHYDSATDSLYIDLGSRTGADADEVAPGIVLDYDAEGKVVGIDIQHASTIVDLHRLDTEFFPVTSPEETPDSTATKS